MYTTTAVAALAAVAEGAQACRMAVSGGRETGARSHTRRDAPCAMHTARTGVEGANDKHKSNQAARANSMRTAYGGRGRLGQHTGASPREVGIQHRRQASKDWASTRWWVVAAWH